MSDTTTTTSNSYTSPTGAPWCATHGYQICNCFSIVPSPAHAILSTVTCATCGQTYQWATGHLCPGPSTPTWTGNATPYWTGTTSATWGTSVSASRYREVKEITTDAELIYEYNFGSPSMKLPLNFSDCFLKVGYTWTPLYPLIFSALEDDSTEMSFHLVVGISDKTFEGDLVILKSVTITKIEDNLTLMQLTERSREYLKKDESK